MSHWAQLQTFLSASVCIAVFICAIASAGLGYKGESNLSKALFFVTFALGVLNVVITPHLLVLTFSIFVGLAGWVFAAILKNVFGVPAIEHVPESAKEAPPSI